MPTKKQVDAAVMQANEKLEGIFNVHVILGRYETATEERESEEEAEKPYWCISGNPLLGGDLLSWALSYLLRKALNGEPFPYIDEDGNRQEITLQDLFNSYNKLEEKQ